MLSKRIQELYEEQLAKRPAEKRYILLYEVIRRGIASLEFPAGEFLPPTRALAQSMSVSRSTVVKAYELLSVEGYLDAKVGSGHRIRAGLQKEKSKLIQPLDLQAFPGLSDMGQAFLNNVHLMNSTEEKSIAFRPGLPPLDIFPVNQWKSLSNLYWRQIRSSELNYSPSAGLRQLRQHIAAYLALSRGIRCEAEQVFIVSGSVQSLFLIGSSLINPGDGVVVENPTFPNVHTIFRSLRAQLHGIPTDEEGLIPEALPREASIKLLHLTPSCHYPFGATLSLKRREQLLDWAQSRKAVIIENDYEHEINRSRGNLPSMYSLDQGQRTVFLGTFNRILHPAIRIGYMVAPPYLVKPLEAFMKHSHRFLPPSLQLVFNQFMEKKHLYTHIKAVRDVAQERQLLFEKEFNRHFQGRMQLQLIPHSLHALAYPLEEQDDQTLVTVLNKGHISTHSLSKCYVADTPQQGLILGYSSARPPVLKSKIAQMSQLLQSASLL